MAFPSIKSLNSFWGSMHAAIRTPCPLTHAGAPLIRRSLQKISRFYIYPPYKSGLSNAKIILVSFESVTIASLPRTWDVGRIEIMDQFSLLRNCPPTHHFALSEKEVLMLALGRGRWAVSQEPKLTRNKLHAPKFLSHKARTAIYMLLWKVPQSCAPSCVHR